MGISDRKGEAGNRLFFYFLRSDFRGFFLSSLYRIFTMRNPFSLKRFPIDGFRERLVFSSLETSGFTTYDRSVLLSVVNPLLTVELLEERKDVWFHRSGTAGQDMTPFHTGSSRNQ